MYILASKKNGTLYVGITSNLERRIWQHKNNIIKGFTKRYKVHIHVYVEEFSNIEDAIRREKEIKGKTRKYKIQLIENNNPLWNGLYEV